MEVACLLFPFLLPFHLFVGPLGLQRPPPPPPRIRGRPLVCPVYMGYYLSGSPISVALARCLQQGEAKVGGIMEEHLPVYYAEIWTRRVLASEA
ncbi:hypothetical protein FKM82_019307 [Ascaphus truei]